MKSHQLKITNNSGSHDARQDKYHIDGKRVSYEEYRTLRDGAVRMDTFLTTKECGAYTHYCTAYTP